MNDENTLASLPKGCDTVKTQQTLVGILIFENNEDRLHNDMDI